MPAGRASAPLIRAAAYAQAGRQQDLARASLGGKAVFPAVIQASLDPGQPGITVGQWLDGWLAAKTRTRRASTVRGYESHIRVHIVPVIGDLPLERLNAGHVETVLAAVPGSRATRHRVLATLRAALNAAVRQRQISYNPCAGIELEPESPSEAQRWTPAQAGRFIEYTADDPLGLLYRVMVLGAARRSEVCGFRWAFADLEVPYADPETGEPRLGAVLTVKRVIIQLGGKLHEEPTAKTKAGDRLVFLDHDTAALLREHRQAQRKARMKAGPAWADNDLVFCQDDGTPWKPDHVSKKLKRLAAKAGVRVIKLHEGGRHTGNSMMYDAEVRPDIVMRQVGHASPEISQRYNHPMKQAHLAASAQVSALVRKAGGGT